MRFDDLGFTHLPPLTTYHALSIWIGGRAAGLLPTAKTHWLLSTFRLVYHSTTALGGGRSPRRASQISEPIEASAMRWQRIARRSHAVRLTAYWPISIPRLISNF